MAAHILFSDVDTEAEESAWRNWLEEVTA